MTALPVLADRTMRARREGTCPSCHGPILPGQPIARCPGRVWHHAACYVAEGGHRPVIGGADEGIWRRIRLVPWDVVIPAAERDEELADRLALELDGVLAWLVAGYRDWHQHGLADPQQVIEATAEYRAESDALGRFLAERCMDHGSVGSTELFKAWSAWCAGEGEEPGTQTGFATALQNKGYDNYSANGRRRWRGLGLVADEEA